MPIASAISVTDQRVCRSRDMISSRLGDAQPVLTRDPLRAEPIGSCIPQAAGVKMMQLQ
jgi:hypothetical protein